MLNEVAAAVVLQHRTWCWFDGIQRRIIQASGNELDAASLRRIAIEYRVMRGLGLRGVEAINEDDELAERLIRLAELLNNASARWPDGLVAKYERCASVVAAARADNCINTDQISAITKFMWFLRPDGWTLFDDRAAAGLGISPGTRHGPRSERFYRKLHASDFCRVAASINVELQREGFVVPGERALDLYLMRRGDRRRQTVAGRTFADVVLPEAYLKVLDGALAERLKRAADAAAAAVGPDPLNLGPA